MNSPLLDIRHLTKIYRGGTTAVKDLSLAVYPGQIYGFIGQNGAGKTTTLKAVAGILPLDEGDIFIDSMSIKTEPIACKKIVAYVPDNPDLYEHLTGVQYLNFIADIFGLSSDFRTQEIASLADQFELSAALGDLVKSYSHGMKQKLVLIGALMHHPKLLILDEPFVGLDPKAAHTLKTLMAAFCEQGNAIFFSTHVLEVAQNICTNIAIIKEGSLVASGLTDEVRGDQSLEELFLELTDE